jgi:hypothetical protein
MNQKTNADYIREARMPITDFPDHSGTGYGDPQGWIESVSLSWPPSTFETTSLEQVEAMARLQAREEEADRIGEFAAKNPDEGTGDSEPTAMSFFAGRPYAEGLAAYNAHLLGQGRMPIKTGAK